MRGEASADLGKPNCGRPSRFQSACAGKRRQTGSSASAAGWALQSACAGKRRRTQTLLSTCTSGGFQSACAGKRRQPGSGRGSGGRSGFQSACAGKGRQTLILLAASLGAGFSPHARGSVGRLGTILTGIAVSVSVRMRGEASADTADLRDPAGGKFQSACAGKRRQTFGDLLHSLEARFSPHARGSVGRPASARRGPSIHYPGFQSACAGKRRQTGRH